MYVRILVLVNANVGIKHQSINQFWLRFKFLMRDKDFFLKNL